MKNGQHVYEYTSKADGKYSMHDLCVIDVNIKDGGERGAFMTVEGRFDVVEKDGGGLTFIMYVNNTGSKESNAQIVTHEATLHGADVDSITETYKKEA